MSQNQCVLFKFESQNEYKITVCVRKALFFRVVGRNLWF